MSSARTSLLIALTLLISQVSGQSSPGAMTGLGQELTSDQRRLTEGSRDAIIKSGISETYFAKHFKLIKVVDQPADQRVVWEFSVDEYRATITDSIGYYTQGGNRIPIHGVANSLGQTFEIRKTLPKPAALKKLRACIGDFAHPSVQYAAINGRAELILSAEAKTHEPSDAKEVARARDRDERKSRPKTDSVAQDEIESESTEKKPPVIIGNINLRTGRCTKGAGLVVPPRSE